MAGKLNIVPRSFPGLVRFVLQLIGRLDSEFNIQNSRRFWSVDTTDMVLSLAENVS
jgi:hypothetical protein